MPCGGPDGWSGGRLGAAAEGGNDRVDAHCSENGYKKSRLIVRLVRQDLD